WRRARSLRRRNGLEVPGRIALDAVRAQQELGVGDELLHRAHVHLTGAQARRTDCRLDVFTMREVLRLEVQRLGVGIEDVSDLLRVLTVKQAAVGIQQQPLRLERTRHRADAESLYFK